MNAGCYGTYVADAFVEAQAVTRAGEVVTLPPAELGFAYRSTALPEGVVIDRGDAARRRRAIRTRWRARMEEQLARRDASQPTKDRTAGLDLPQSGRLFLAPAGPTTRTS